MAFTLTQTDQTVMAVITHYRPTSVGEAAGSFARSSVARVAPVSPTRAKALLWACAKLGAFATSVGLELSPEVLLHPSVIERFILVGTLGLSPAGKRTLRTNLGYVARRMHSNGPDPIALPRERAKAPYSPAQIAGYLALAEAQPSLSRRHRVTGLICLGAGAGLIGADLRRLWGSDVIKRSGGVVVEVRGRRPRVVPVLARYHQPLLAAAAFVGGASVIGGDEPDRHNVTTPLISSLSGGVDLPRLDTYRLRSTWLAACGELIGLKAFMAATGFTCSQRLGDLAAELPEWPERACVTLLGGLG